MQESKKNLIHKLKKEEHRYPRLASPLEGTGGGEGAASTQPPPPPTFWFRGGGGWRSWSQSRGASDKTQTWKPCWHK